MSPSSPESAPRRTRRPLLRLGAFAAVVIAVWMVARATGVLEYLDIARVNEVIGRARESPWAAPVFVVTYAALTALGLPGTVMTLAGGTIFGVVWGTTLNWLGATIGATGAFFLARTLGGGALSALLGKRAAVLERIAGDGAFAAILRLRLIPIVPFNALNFGAGLAGMRPWPYITATAIGIIPGTAIYTYFAGSLIEGVEGARAAAFTNVAIAAALLIALSFLPALARRLGWITAAAILVASPVVTHPQILSAAHGDVGHCVSGNVRSSSRDQAWRTAYGTHSGSNVLFRRTRER
jgi:uncharacterized membrane protein YdjX (TVP38/TMEM64 family)